MDSDTVRMIGDALDRLLGSHELDSTAQNEVSSQEYRAKKLWNDLAEFGILGLFLSSDAGGFDCDLTVLSKTMQVLGKHLASNPYLSTAIVTAKLLKSLDRDDLIERISNNKMVCSIAHWESRDPCDNKPIQTTARLVQSGWSISGSKVLVTKAANTTHIMVTARIEESSDLGIFCIPAKTSGLHSNDFVLIDNSSAQDLDFKKIIAGTDMLIGQIPYDSKLIQEAWDMGTVAVCAESTAILKEIVGSTVEYVKQRKQFGKSLSEFQVVQHQLADMMCELKLAESMLFELLNRPNDPQWISAAKYRIGQASRLIRHNAVQLHGGIGTTDELSLNRYFRRALMIEKSYGSTEVHLARFEAMRDSSLKLKYSTL